MSKSKKQKKKVENRSSSSSIVFTYIGVIGCLLLLFIGLNIENLNISNTSNNDTTISGEAEQTKDMNNVAEDEVIDMPSANIGKDELIKFIDTNKYFGGTNISLKNIEETTFLKDNNIEDVVDYGFVLESDSQEDFEKVIILHSNAEDPIVVRERLMNYYFNFSKVENTTHKQSEQSNKNIENVRLGLKGKYVYVIACKNGEQLESDLVNYLKF